MEILFEALRVIGVILVILLIISVPFAIFGFILLAFMNVFGMGIIITYWNSLIVGLGISLIINLLKSSIS